MKDCATGADRITGSDQTVACCTLEDPHYTTSTGLSACGSYAASGTYVRYKQTVTPGTCGYGSKVAVESDCSCQGDYNKYANPTSCSATQYFETCGISTYHHPLGSFVCSTETHGNNAPNYTNNAVAGGTCMASEWIWTTNGATPDSIQDAAYGAPLADSTCTQGASPSTCVVRQGTKFQSYLNCPCVMKSRPNCPTYGQTAP